MNKQLEKIMYSFGVNGSFYNVPNELASLKKSVPDEFLYRDTLDIGCGDGKVSLKLQSILQSKKYEGIDTSRSLVRTARTNGLKAITKDAEEAALSGDLAVLWGVLHHFKNPTQTLRKLGKEFNLIIIRESVNDNRIFEIGHRLNRKRLMTIIKTAKQKPFKVVDVKENKSLIVFIKCKS